MGAASRTGRAPGKVILLGEHFVVHGVPALALPVPSRGVEITVVDAPGPWEVADHAREHLRAMLEALGVDPDEVALTVRATLPFGAGLGGSAALAVALVRALGDDDPEVVRAKAHQLERLAHGTPSGVDDTVATYAAPVRFVRGQPPEVLTGAPAAPLWIARGPDGASTRAAVAGVRELAEGQPAFFAERCDLARDAVERGCVALCNAQWRTLGAAMDVNHALLQQIGVSTPTLDAMVDAARDAGAVGAKLTGGGLGGCVIALAPDATGDAADALEAALRDAGATDVLRP